MELAAKYSPAAIEEKWYQTWLDKKYFKSTPDERESYTIVIPPPNVTGVLHMGHMLNNTIQDVLIRRARMLGYNACWVPGTDHASIATEAKVVNRLKEKGIKKEDIGRDAFLKHAWDWTDEHGGIILEQLKKLGASCDWDRTRFTLDEDYYKSVIKVFVDLFNKGKIYRGYRMVNWDPEAKTTISDEEVNYVQKNGKLYYINYQVADSDQKVTIATTRPETILGDSAICVNPEDDRYKDLVGKEVIVPIAGRKIPVIADEYVDVEFGTGCLKITPAHDVNDKAIGDKHKLEVIDIFNDDASLNAHGLHYEGKDRFVVRKEIAKELEEKGFMHKVEDYVNNVGTSERTGAVIEPKISRQWFLAMQDIVKPAIDAVKNKEVQLIPEKFENTYYHWMENIHEWNISRQLWWGHQIPAYYDVNNPEQFVVATSIEEACELASKEWGRSVSAADLRQDDDALDTWFSSWIWPIAVFNGILDPKNEEVSYYYPTKNLVTGPDILFFWVARMIMSGYEYEGQKPFDNVYLTGIVRDKQGRKMSKSLGNSPDPVKLMDEYGADSVRMGMLLTAPAGNDLPFDTDLCIQGRNFANKIWNAYRLTQSWEVEEKVVPASSQVAMEWFENQFNARVKEINKSFEQFKISEALMSTYKLIWDDFCSWYLEAVKPPYGEAIPAAVLKQTKQFYKQLLGLLHPFMPFITEELYQALKEEQDEESIMFYAWPEEKEVESNILDQVVLANEIISGVRTFRKENNVPNKDAIELKTIGAKDLVKVNPWIEKIGNVSSIEEVSDKVAGAHAYMVKNMELFIPVSEAIDVEDAIAKLEEELKYTEGFLNSVMKKLSNEKFVSGAPEKVVQMEQKKKEDAEEKISILKEKIAGLTV